MFDVQCLYCCQANQSGFRDNFLQKIAANNFETLSLLELTRSYPRHFTFYVAHPIQRCNPQPTPRGYNYCGK